jgi:hypothetical protein
VITNLNVNLTADATVHGLCVHLTAYTRFGGTGKMTIGAGGIVKTGLGEMNVALAKPLVAWASRP